MHETQYSMNVLKNPYRYWEWSGWGDWTSTRYTHERSDACDKNCCQDHPDFEADEKFLKYSCGLSSGRECDMKGWIPRYPARERFPIAIHVLGTGQEISDLTAERYAWEMAKRGFCGFTVSYDKNSLLEYGEGRYYDKSLRIYSLSMRHSAIRRIMWSDSRCDVTKGVVTSGFSQGGHIALWAKAINRHVKGCCR